MKNILFFTTNNELPFKLINDQLKQLYHFTLLRDIKNAVQLICKQHVDLCIIEKSEEGIRLIQSLKLIDETTPILLLANVDDTEDKIKLFELNCTEYMFQPFLSRELVLRIENAMNTIKATKRPPLPTTVETTTIGNSFIDFRNRIFQSPSGNQLLSHKENELLKILCINRNTLITREQILMHIWKKMTITPLKAWMFISLELEKFLRKTSALYYRIIMAPVTC